MYKSINSSSQSTFICIFYTVHSRSSGIDSDINNNDNFFSCKNNRMRLEIGFFLKISFNED